MKISCSQKDLRSALEKTSLLFSQANRTDDTKFDLSTEARRVRITAATRQSSINCWVDATIDREGSFSIAAQPFSGLINSPPDGEMALSFEPESGVLSIRSARFEAILKGAQPHAHRAVQTPKRFTTIPVNTSDLLLAIRLVAVAAASLDNTRPTLEGVHVVFDNTTFTFEAADGFRMSRFEGILSSSLPKRIDIIVPASELGKLHQVLSSTFDASDDPTGQSREIPYIDVVVARHDIIFRTDRLAFNSWLSGGTFPRTEGLWPRNCRTMVTVEAKRLLLATRLGALVDDTIRLTLVPGRERVLGKIVIQVHSDKVGDVVHEIDTIVEGQESKVAISAGFLTDVLSTVPNGSVVILETTDPGSPVKFKISGIPNYAHLIMPRYVQW